MYRYLLMLLGSIWMSHAWAQRPADVTGTVQDSAQQPLAGASIMLLKAQDSTLGSFALSDEQGRYRLSRVPNGEYLLQITMMGYARHSEPLSVQGGADRPLSPIVLVPKDLTLETVEIRAEQSPMRMKGDTLEYDAERFSPQAGDNVEELLRRLPGMEVDREGNVKALGEKVSKVLVDGKEFFGDDPQVATKNLPADAIDRVQVFDRKSDAEQFTGVDDGQRMQTINLALKEDRKKGLFGTLEAGYGTEDRFALKGNLNRFSGSTQLSALGRFNNLNQQGFGIEDYLSFMGGLRNLMGSGGRINLNADGGGSGVPLNLGNGQERGFITSGSGGLNGNLELSERLRLNSSYFFSGVDRQLAQSRYREQFLSEASFMSEEESRYASRYYNHRLSTRLRYFGDTLRRFNVGLNLGWNQGRVADTTLSRTLDREGNLENETDRLSGNQAQQADVSLRASYQRNLGQKGRTLSLEGQVNGQWEDRSGFLQSFNRLYPGGMPRVDSLQQAQQQEQQELGYQVKVAYTEPVGPGNFLTLDYSHQTFQDEEDRQVFDLWPERQISERLSNRFRRSFAYHRSGLAWTRNGEKSYLSLELKGQRAELKGELLSLGDTVQQVYHHALPGLTYRYDFSDSRRMSLRYRSSVQAPSIRQLQPVIDNRDPLNLYRGNPDLRPAYRHRVNVSYSLYDQFSFISLFAGANASYVENAIVEARSVDSLLRQLRQPVNTAGAWEAGGYSNFSAPLRFMRAKFTLVGRWQYRRGLAFINEVESEVTRQVYGVDFRLENRNKKRVDLAIGVDLNQNVAQYAHASRLDRQFLNQRYYSDVRVTLGKNWQLKSSLDWSVFGREGFVDQLQVPLWQASVQRGFLDQQLRVEAVAFDLLDRNQGLSRNAELAYLEEVRTQTLSRYFMLKVSYSITSLGAQR